MLHLLVGKVTGGSSSPPSPWASPTKPPEVRKPRPFQPPLLKTLNLSSSASNSTSLLRGKENLIEVVKEKVKKNRKSEKENVELGTKQRGASQGGQMLHKSKKEKASSVLSFEEEMETSTQQPGEASLKASKARPTRPSTGTWYSEQQVGFKYFCKIVLFFQVANF